MLGYECHAGPTLKYQEMICAAEDKFSMVNMDMFIPVGVYMCVCIYVCVYACMDICVYALVWSCVCIYMVYLDISTYCPVSPFVLRLFHIPYNKKEIEEKDMLTHHASVVLYFQLSTLNPICCSCRELKKEA